MKQLLEDDFFVDIDHFASAGAGSGMIIAKFSLLYSRMTKTIALKFRVGL